MKKVKQRLEIIEISIKELRGMVESLIQSTDGSQEKNYLETELQRHNVRFEIAQIIKELKLLEKSVL